MEMNMKDAADPSILVDIQDCFGQMSIVSNCQMEDDSNFNASESSPCNTKEDVLVDYLQLSTCNDSLSSDNFLCLGESERYYGSFELNLSKEPKRHYKKTLPELNKYSLKQLQVLIEDLTQSVEHVSSELVELLLENDALQQESDARNIAIEQLLKMTVNVNESELKPVQMSVILPDDNYDDV